MSLSRDMTRRREKLGLTPTSDRIRCLMKNMVAVAFGHWAHEEGFRAGHLAGYDTGYRGGFDKGLTESGNIKEMEDSGALEPA